MEEFPNYYDFLDISHDASDEDIQKAYKVKAKKYHPDKNQGDETAKEKFQYLGEAKECLSDPKKRLAYDFKIGARKRPEQRNYTVPPRPEAAQQHKTRSSSSAENAIIAGVAAMALGVFLAWLLKDEEES